MPTPSSNSPTRVGLAANVPRAIRFCLRGGSAIAGTAFIPAPLALAPFLRTRRGGLLTLAAPTGGTATASASHVMVRLASILYCWAPTGDIAVEHAAAGATRRRIAVTFDDGSAAEGVISVPGGQRVSDFLARAEDFIAVRDVAVSGADAGPVDVALNIDAVTTVRDLGLAEAGAPPSMRTTQVGGAAPGVATPTPAARTTVVQRRISTLTLLAADDS